MSASTRRAFASGAVMASGAMMILGGRAMANAEECASNTDALVIARLRAETGAGPLQVSGVVSLDIDPDAAFTVATEIEQMIGWMSGLQGGTYQGREPGQGITAGDIRRLSFGPEPDQEQIVAVERPSAFAYAITGGMPIEAHLALMTFTAEGGGTRFAWHQCFAGSQFFPVAIIRRRRVRGFVESSLARLAAETGGAAPIIC